MKYTKNIAIAFLISYGLFSMNVFAVDFSQADLGGLRDNGILGEADGQGDFIGSTKAILINVLEKIKIVLNGIALIALLYVAGLLIINFGEESRISEGRKKFLYTVIGLILINVPESIYRVLSGTYGLESNTLGKVTRGGTIGRGDNTANFSEGDLSGCNILFCPGGLTEGGVIMQAVRFLEVILVAVAVIMLTYGGIRLIIAAGDEEQKKVQRRRFIYGLIALLLAGFVDTIYRVVFLGGIAGTDALPPLIKVANIFLFFAGPIAIIFLIIGGYLLITSAGSEDKVRRAKSILINTFLAVILLLLSYVFIVELSGINL